MRRIAIPASPPSASGSRATSAPRAVATSRLASMGSTAMTLSAPASRASCTAISPIAPRPKTATWSPSRISASRIASAMTAGSRHTAVSGLMPSGRGSTAVSSTVCVSRTGRCPNTRSPSRKRVASGPTSETTPTAMLPRGKLRGPSALRTRDHGSPLGVVRAARRRLVAVADQLGAVLRRGELRADRGSASSPAPAPRTPAAPASVAPGLPAHAARPCTSPPPPPAVDPLQPAASVQFVS